MYRHVSRIVCGCLAAVSLIPPANAQSLEESERLAAFQARRDSLIDFFADAVPADDLTRGGYLEIAANLHRGRRHDWVLARLDSILAQPPRGDMFWMFPFVTAYLAGDDVLPEDYRSRMRDLWRTYMPYRGDTENHWALYYSTLYLMAEAHPGEPGETWYTGKSSEENLAEARDYLLHWMNLTTTIGQGEYDSPHYIDVFVVPMALLYAHARDPEMRQRAQMMLDYFLADFAVESIGGLYGGAFSRIYEVQIVEPWRTQAPRFAWLLWGNVPFYHAGASLVLALSGYVPPRVLDGAATDRSAPYVHRELKRTRHRIRHSSIRNAPVYKYSFVRPEYVLGSSQGGLLQPIQQQTWGLVWQADDPRGLHNVLFSVQPYSSPIEGTMYFAEHPDIVTELIVRSKTEYDSPDKLSGGSPYEQVFQHEDALVALYDIAEGSRFPHISAFFSRDLSRFEENESGWIFARGGDAFIAYYPLAPYEWREIDGGDRRLHSPHRKNGLVLQTAPASAFSSFEAFVEAVRSLPLETARMPVPHVRFQTLGGDQLEASYGDTPKVNGTAVDYDAWPLFDGPFLRADKGSKRLEMRHGPLRRLLDFDTLTIRDWIEE